MRVRSCVCVRAASLGWRTPKRVVCAHAFSLCRRVLGGTVCRAQCVCKHVCASLPSGLLANVVDSCRHPQLCQQVHLGLLHVVQCSPCSSSSRGLLRWL